MLKHTSFLATIVFSFMVAPAVFAQAFTAQGMRPGGLNAETMPAEVMRLKQRVANTESNTLPQLEAQVSQVHEKVKRNQASIATIQQSLLNEETPEGAIDALRQQINALTARIEALEAQQSTTP